MEWRNHGIHGLEWKEELSGSCLAVGRVVVVVGWPGGGLCFLPLWPPPASHLVSLPLGFPMRKVETILMSEVCDKDQMSNLLKIIGIRRWCYYGGSCSWYCGVFFFVVVCFWTADQGYFNLWPCSCRRYLTEGNVGEWWSGQWGVGARWAVSRVAPAPSQGVSFGCSEQVPHPRVWVSQGSLSTKWVFWGSVAWG